MLCKTKLPVWPNIYCVGEAVKLSTRFLSARLLLGRAIAPGPRAGIVRVGSCVLVDHSEQHRRYDPLINTKSLEQCTDRSKLWRLLILRARGDRLAPETITRL